MRFKSQTIKLQTINFKRRTMKAILLEVWQFRAYRRQRLPMIEWRIRNFAVLLAANRERWSRLFVLGAVH
jgi:hypothetical protein